MTNVNLSNLYSKLQQIQEETQSQQGGGRKYPFRAVFIKPDDPAAKLQVRILYNMKEQAVTFSYFTHKVGESTLPCGKNNRNNPVCELCDAIAARKAVTGIEMKEASKSRTMMLAQYVRSLGYKWDPKWPEPAQGDTILVIGPSSLHRQISDMLVTVGPKHLPELLTSAEGKVISLSRDGQGKQIVATPTYESYRSANDDNQFAAFLGSLPGLEEIALFGGMTDEDYLRLHKAAFAVQGIQAPDIPQTTARPSIDQMAESAADKFKSMPSMNEPTYKAQTYTAPMPAATTIPNYSTSTISTVQSGTVSEPTTRVISPQVQANISEFCQKKFNASNPVCQMCLAEPECPFKAATGPILTITSDDLPF